MIPTRSKAELLRLVAAFAREADKFPEITLRILYLTQNANPTPDFRLPNHAIFLWQCYGIVDGESSTSGFLNNLKTSDMKWGIRGCQFTSMAVLEGSATPLFVRMASRAGGLFTEARARRIGTRAIEDFATNAPTGKPVSVYNHHPLAVWINFVLHRLGKTHTGYFAESQIVLEPFASSLTALESLLRTKSQRGKPQQGATAIAKKQFSVALSFPGTHRGFVETVAKALSRRLGSDSVFYDRYYEAELARPNLDTVLHGIYQDQSELVVVFLCRDYHRREWCGLEWRTIRNMIKKGKDERIMFLCLDEDDAVASLSIDGFVNVKSRTAEDVSSLICRRLDSLKDPQ